MKKKTKSLYDNFKNKIIYNNIYTNNIYIIITKNKLTQ